MAAVLLLAVGASDAQAKLVPEPRSYHAFDFFHIGYQDKQNSDGTWQIIANARGIDGPGFASDMALYRAAELSVSAGHSYVQVLASSGVTRLMYNQAVGEKMKVTVRFVDRADPPVDCRSRAQDCMTLEAAAVIARIGPTLHGRVQ